MEGRFSVNRVESQGIDNAALELQENGLTNRDTVGELVNTTSATCLHDHPGRRRRSLVQLTREALPRLENYRNSKRALKRPSLGELHGGDECFKVRNYYFSIIHFKQISSVIVISTLNKLFAHITIDKVSIHLELAYFRLMFLTVKFVV